MKVTNQCSLPGLGDQFAGCFLPMGDESRESTSYDPKQSKQGALF